MLTFDKIASPYGRAYRVTGPIEATITLIKCDLADDQALLAEALDQHRKLQALGKDDGDKATSL